MVVPRWGYMLINDQQEHVSSSQIIYSEIYGDFMNETHCLEKLRTATSSYYYFIPKDVKIQIQAHDNQDNIPFMLRWHYRY